VSVFSVAAAIVRVELRQLIRDQRAILAAVLLPAVLYPIMFMGQNALQDLSRETLAAREVHVAYDLTRAPELEATRALALFESRTPMTLRECDSAELFALSANTALEQDVFAARERDLVRSLFQGEEVLLVTAEVHPTALRRTIFHLYYDVKKESGREARGRVREALRELDDELTDVRHTELLGIDPAGNLELETLDVASEEDSSGAALGALLPLLAVVVLLSGGSYAALAIFAGEREAGTLETLLVQPVGTSTIAAGKFIAVLIAGLVTLGCNLTSLLACVYFGIGELPDLATSGSLGFSRVLATAVYLPGCLLMLSVLCYVCGRARSFREGQATLLPVLLLTLAPTAIVLQPSVQMDYLLAIIPFAGPSIALRDALRGSLQLGPVIVMTISHLFWSGIVLSRLASILDAERVLGGADTESESGARQLQARHSLRWGFIGVLAVYVIGGWLQSRGLQSGMILTLWVLLPALTLFCAMRRPTGEPLTERLGLRVPAWNAALGAVLLAPCLAFLAKHFSAFQQKLLPMPEGALPVDMDTWMTNASTGTLFFLFALSPGICEELFFRGAVLHGMRRDLPALKVVMWQALLFGAVHASIYRLAPTAILGALLALITLRARSIVPAVLLHVTYNGLVLGVGLERLPEWMGNPWLALAAIPGVLLLIWRPAGAFSR
jgi:ABC-2 type transport system permease protein/sodium transport system permease protein